MTNFSDLHISKAGLEQFKIILEDWIPENASVAIAANDKYLFFSASTQHIPFNIEETVNSNSVAAQVLQTRQKTEALLDESIFGKPYLAIGYPIYLDQLEAALIIILPTSHVPKKKEPYKFLTGKQNEDWTPIPIEQISHIESLQKKTWFYSDNEQYKTNTTLKELQERLPDFFVRIHRSYILNIYSVKKISRDLASNFVIHLKNGTELPVSQSYLNNLRKSLEF